MERDVLLSGAPLTMMQNGLGFEAMYALSETMDTTEYHCHDFYEFYIHIRGGQYFGLDDVLYQLLPFQVFVVPPFSMHGLSSDRKLSMYERAYINLTPETLKTLGCGQIDLDRFFRGYVSQGQYTFQLAQDDARRCIQWISELQDGISSRDPLVQFGNYGKLMSFLDVICRSISSARPLQGKVISNSVIQEILTYINGNYTQPLRIEALARRFGVSVSYLSHEFARFTNRSVYDYILYRRVMLARQLMQTDISLNAIAYQCGFNDYSNFLRMFNKLVGMSPSQFRRQQRGAGSITG